MSAASFENRFKDMVLVTTVSGEKMIGDIEGTRENFEEPAKEGKAVKLLNSRNLSVSEVQKDVGGGQVAIGMSVNLMALPPFMLPVPEQYVRLSAWVFIDDNKELFPALTALISQAEKREIQMRASAMGIDLVSGVPARAPGAR